MKRGYESLPDKSIMHFVPIYFLVLAQPLLTENIDGEGKKERKREREEFDTSQ